MVSLNNILEIGKTGLMAHQARMAVASHNIVNVNTPGYRRQRVLLETQPPLDVSANSTRKITFGSGVKIADIVRDYDLSMERALGSEISSTGYHDQLAQALRDAQGMLVGTGEADFAAQMTEFWNAWQDVANNADTVAYRSVLLQKTDAMCSMFNDMAARLGEYRNDISAGSGADATGAVARNVKDINSIADKIADLNQKIKILSIRGNDANDLLDERDLLVRDLSELVNTDIVYEQDATYTILVDGQELVTDSTSNHIVVTSSEPVGLELNGEIINPEGGELKAWIDSVDVFEDIISQLDTMALEMVALVNNAHSSGYDLDGVTGVNFFDPGTTGAADIRLDTMIEDNPRAIAAAANRHWDGSAWVPNVGDGANALAIADIGEENLVGLNNQTFNAFYVNLLADLGTTILTEEALADHNGSVVDMISNTLAGQSGVNLDEEMTEILSAQRAYAASAKVVSMADELLDIIINRM